MKNVTINSIADIENLLQAEKLGGLSILSRKEKYECINETLIHIKYGTLCKKDKGLVKTFLRNVTGYSDMQIKRLIREWKEKGLTYRKQKSHGATIPTYKPEDIALLIETDILHRTPNGNAVREIFKREFFIFNKKEYETISKISSSHIYNIRNNKKQYLSSEAVKYSKTNTVSTSIGERRKPAPNGIPGYLRIDSVHQGDFGGEKGVYHINIIDEVTQWEVVGCVPHITDEYMIPLIEKLLKQFPFVILNFHSDNGSEYINKQIANMLERIRVSQTKSRARKTNDQALVEGKNGSIIRKHIGRNHIPRVHAKTINNFYEDYFNTYLNYHRVCAFPTDYMDKRGKIRKKYETYITPYEKLKAIPDAERYLRHDVTFEKLDVTAYSQSDNEFAKNMKKGKNEMINTLKK